MKNLYEVMGSSKLKLKEYGGPAEMLQAKGTEKIKINAVKFGIQTGAAVQIIQEKIAPEPSKGEANIDEAIEKFKRLIEKGLTALEMKQKFNELIESTNGMSTQNQIKQGEALAKILENLPYEYRIELLKEVELKPFVLKVLSNLDEKSLLQLIITQEGRGEGIKKILSNLSDDKFAKLLPMLKEKIPNIYEYLAQMGLILSEKLTSVFSREDLYSTIRPYYNMLDSQNAKVREEGIKSLATIAGRFLQQGHLEITTEIIQKICLVLEQEAVVDVVNDSIEEISNLYNIARSFNLEKICDMIVEPFNKILSRPDIPLQIKKALINFVGETQNRVALSALMSLLWESGVYPEVRAAIVKIGKGVVPELLLTLKEAEDYSLRMKIIDILKNIGKDVLDILLKNIDTPEWYMRKNIVNIIAEIGDKEICPKLEILINDPEDRVRLELVRAFIKLEYEKGLKVLLKDPAIEIRAESLRGLRKTISNEEISELLAALKDRGDAFHAELLKIIGERKLTTAYPFIVDYLRNIIMRDDQIAQELKQIAFSTLIRLSPLELRTILEEFANSRDKLLAELARSAIKRIG